MNWELVGHEWAVSLLAGHLTQGKVRHAYLITGPQGVGRRTLALRFAQALNCPQPLAIAAPCMQCRTCLQIEHMQHADLAIVQAEEQGGVLKVDQVRQLGRSLALHPYEAAYRVAILLRFEEAHPSAMNALLKNLEDPPSRVVFLLHAVSPEDLLPTIVSRCEVLRLRPLPLLQVEEALQTNWGLSVEQARLLAHISNGRIGYALRLVQEPERLRQRQKWLDLQENLLSATRVERFSHAETLSKEKELFRDVVTVWLTFWRDVMLKASGSSVPISNVDRIQRIEGLANHLGMCAARKVVSSLVRTLDLLEININVRLAAEVLMLDLPHL